MNWRNLILAGLAGAAIGFVITKKQTESMTPERALNHFKDKASQRFRISGTWILVKPEDVNVHGLPFTVYKGGFSHSEAGQKSLHYEFLIDAGTGTLIELTEK
jgi:predicted small secreted protein